jgi:1-acyl-sn-glycerol-3-phosphate acyltransferase
MPPRYPLPLATLSRLLPALVLSRSLSFQREAQDCVALLNPPLQVNGREHIPQSGPCLLTTNHYTRPGFQAWWIPLAINSVMPVEIHWIMTAAWTFEGRPRAIVLKPLSERLFAHIAGVYRFSTMPPMPPDPNDTPVRAQAVRRVLRYARQTEKPVIGLAPEGRDIPGGGLGWPPPGTGRFINHLAQCGLPLLPIGVFEGDGVLQLRFGPAYRLPLPAETGKNEVDIAVSRIVMEHIAQQMPPALRGEFNYV